MEDYYEYLDSNGVTTLYKLIKDDTVALIDSYSVTINGITTTLDNHVNNADIHTPISTIEGMIDTAVGSLNYATPDYVDTKIAGLVNSAPETLDTLKELSDALGNDSNFATTVANQIGSKADKDDVYTKGETDTLLEGKANSVHSHVVSDITDFPTIPTKTSQLINDSGFLTSSNGLITSVSWSDITNKPNFSTVATSGSYNDLSNKPTIPNVYNKTLTIRKNGTNVATFTSNSNTDVTADITVPTKVSELSNDSGFITGISWDKVTNKPTLATVATSGSYTDLSNTPTIPTKVSQLENDMGFGTGGDTSDCVHKTGDETIAGVKTFTASPFVSNYAVTNGYFTQLNDVARNKVPSQIYHSAFRVFDKNDKTLGEYCVEKSTSGSSLLHMDVHTEDSEGNDIMESLYLNLSNDGSTVSFHPAKNNRTDLGMAHYKWAKIYSDDVVHTSGNETIDGIKTFTSGPCVTNKLTTAGYSIKNADIARNEVPTQLYHATFRAYDKNDKILGEYCVEKSTGGESLLNMNVRSEDASGNQIAYGLQFRMTNDGSIVRFIPSANNKVHLGDVNAKWLKVHSDDVVHTSGTETINGSKTFTSSINLKNNNVDLTVTPSSTLTSNIIFKDKNDQNVSFIQYAKRNIEPDVLGLYINDKDKNLHGIQITSNNYLLPMGNNIYNLGSPNNIWANAYIANTITNTIITYSVKNHNDTSSMTVSGGSSWDKGSTLFLYGNSHSKHPGAFNLTAKNTTNTSQLIGFPNGTLTWGGKSLAIDENLVHRSGNEVIKGVKYFDNLVYLHDNMSNKNSQMDLFTTPANTLFSHYMFVDKNNKVSAYMQYGQQNTGTDFIGLFIHDKTRALHGIEVTTNNEVIPLSNNTYSLGSITNKWKNAYATTFNGNLNGNANTASYATTQATSDNSTKIATTAWVRTYVNSVVGSGSVGASISAYYSNSITVTATGDYSDDNDEFPADYSIYINIAPTVGTIYTGSQLFSSFTPTASGSINKTSLEGSPPYRTTAKATATFSGAFSPSARYLCTTANAVKFRAYVSQGTPSSMGSPSVVDNSSAKSIFIRVQ